MDRGHVATWVRLHPALILWVRNKIGRCLKGWRPYENWANTPDGIDEEYILDDGLRLHNGSKRMDKGLSVKEGLHKLRSALFTPGTSVRLTGLSGVAIEIVNDWLDHDGWIGKSIDSLNSLGIDILKNIAPVSPGKTLDAIERATNGSRGASFRLN